MDTHNYFGVLSAVNRHGDCRIPIEAWCARAGGSGEPQRMKDPGFTSGVELGSGLEPTVENGQTPPWLLFTLMSSCAEDLILLCSRTAISPTHGYNNNSHYIAHRRVHVALHICKTTASVAG